MLSMYEPIVYTIVTSAIVVLVFVLTIIKLIRVVRKNMSVSRNIFDRFADRFDDNDQPATKTCAYCGCEASASATQCPSCGAPLKK